MDLLSLLLRRGKKSLSQNLYTDEYGYQWVNEDFFGFGDLSRAKDTLGLDLPTAEEHLKRHWNEHPWKTRWLKHGTSFPAPSRRDCLEMKRLGGHLSGNCYNNALAMAVGLRGEIVFPKRPKVILYGEGLAVNPTGAHLHAWLVLDGEVYDPTWPDAYRATYFGITLIPEKVLVFAETFGRVSLIQNWQEAEKYLDICGYLP